MIIGNGFWIFLVIANMAKQFHYEVIVQCKDDEITSIAAACKIAKAVGNVGVIKFRWGDDIWAYPESRDVDLFEIRSIKEELRKLQEKSKL